MFGIGPQELIVILIVALLVLGPKRLPEIARSLGKGLAEFRRASSDLRQSLALDDEPKPKPSPRGPQQAAIGAPVPATPADPALTDSAHRDAAHDDAAPEGATPAGASAGGDPAEGRSIAPPKSDEKTPSGG